MHFFHCINFLIPTLTFFQKIRNIDDKKFLSQSETKLIQPVFYGKQNYHLSINKLIIILTTEYTLFYKQHFYKQRQTENRKKSSKC